MFSIYKSASWNNTDYGNCCNLFRGWHAQLIVTFYGLAKSINFHFIRELMGTFFSGKFWNASTCPPLNQSSKMLSYASALITLASWWLWPHQGHRDAFASFRCLFSCAVHICASAFSVLKRMHERPIKNYQKPTRTRPLTLMFCFKFVLFSKQVSLTALGV